MNTETQLNSKFDEDDLIAKSWEILQPVGEGRYAGNYIRYYAKGKISWGQQVQDALGNPERVELRISRDKKAVGFKKVEQGGFRVQSYKSAPTVHGFQCKLTFKGNGLNADVSFRKEFVRMGDIAYVIAPELFR